MMKKIHILPLLIIPLLVSCVGTDSDMVDDDRFVKDTNAFDILMGQFAHDIENIWGHSEILIAGPKDYVKYTDNYHTRSHINFDSGTITIEVLSSDNPREALHKAIVSTLLMSENPGSINLYSDSEDVPTSTEPFLLGQVVDETGEPIRWEWRASHYANYLVDNQLKTRISGLHLITYVTIQLVANHVDQRAHKFLPLIRDASRQHKVEESLILAIMQIESSFNPYAVSRSDALGLMQVQPHTAGKDVFKFTGRSGQPSRSYLLDPKKNINMGTAYIAILRDHYLAGIENPTSRRYATITAYNGGAGSVLRVFSADRNKAIAAINRMTPEQVYKALTTKHPSTESRNYLQKVHNVQKGYNYR